MSSGRGLDSWIKHIYIGPEIWDMTEMAFSIICRNVLFQKMYISKSNIWSGPDKTRSSESDGRSDVTDRLRLP